MREEGDFMRPRGAGVVVGNHPDILSPFSNACVLRLRRKASLGAEFAVCYSQNVVFGID